MLSRIVQGDPAMAVLLVALMACAALVSIWAWIGMLIMLVAWQVGE